MSLSSGATLTTSPVNTITPATPHAPPNPRRSSHGASHHHQHVAHGKRRQTSHSHHVAHAHGHASTSAQSNAGPSRRSSEGEHGRRALAAGLTMAVMDGDGPGKPKRKGSGDRPIKKASRSDTNLPRLSRVNSHASATSNHSRRSSHAGSRPGSRAGSRTGSRTTSPVRPSQADRKLSTDSVELDDEGNVKGTVDPNEEGWEEDEEAKKSSRPETPRAATQSSQDMRRTLSDTHAHPRPKSRTGNPPAEATGLGILGRAKSDRSPSVNLSAITKKTTGFAGPTHTPDPTMVSSGHALNDPTHIMPAHQIKHQQSARSLHAIQHAQQTQNGDDVRITKEGSRSMSGLSRTDSEGSQNSRTTPGSATVGGFGKRTESALSMTKTSGETPPSQLHAQRPPDTSNSQPADARPPIACDKSSSHSQAISDGESDEQFKQNDPSDRRVVPEPSQPHQPTLSPSYPFPRLPNEASPAATVKATSPTVTAIPPDLRSREVSSSSTTPTASIKHPPPMPANNTNKPGPSGRQLRHRYSNSSIRSTQSLRAAPHPLNSPTGGYRSGSAHPSPMKSRGPSLHHPPVAPPVINKEAAEGVSWHGPGSRVVSVSAGSIKGIPENGPMTGSGGTPERRSTRAPSAALKTAPPLPRSSSFSSIRSITNLLSSTTGISTAAPGTPSEITNADGRSNTGSVNRRPTALEAASAASKLKSTNDPVAYHASLGFPSTSAETVHLISRFLPPPKVRRPAWEISPDAARNGYIGIGLTNGDYRESHEGLVRTMRTMGMGGGAGGNIPGTLGTRRGMNRTASYSQSLLQNISGQGSGGSASLTPPATGTSGSRRLGGDRTPQASASQGGSSYASPTHVARQLSLTSLDEVNNVGVLKGRNGNLLVGRGGWDGRTPFELSLERVFAQRPVRSLSAGQ